ncbi:MAG: hypothetical protein MJB12_05490, partial [Firmicutes bacterium]|nr:hypothetical protein [Bacillota bacterium]
MLKIKQRCFKTIVVLFLMMFMVMACLMERDKLLPRASASEGLFRFSVVEPQAKYPRGLQVSARYRVLVKRVSDNTPWDTSAHFTATYDAWPDYLDPEHIPQAYVDNHVHIAQVDASERIRFRVELIDESAIDTIKLKPSRYAEMRNTQENGQN